MRKALLILMVGMASAILGPSCCSTVPAGPVTISTTGRTMPWDWDPELFEASVRALEAQCPLNAPATIAVRQIEGPYWGLTHYLPDEGSYLIEIEGAQPMHAILNTLEHEWAHAMVWDASSSREHAGHGPIWGVAWAKCYRVVLSVIAPETP